MKNKREMEFVHKTLFKFSHRKQLSANTNSKNYPPFNCLLISLINNKPFKLHSHSPFNYPDF